MSEAATNGQAPEAPTEFSEQFRADAARLVGRYPVARSALLPLLHLVQAEHGYVSEAGVAFCAAALDLTKAEVGAVATFYTMFKREPVGDYLLSVCTNPTCQVAGSQVIFERYRDALGDRLTDPETGVSIEQAECLGICDAAPVVQVNYEMYGPLTDEEADRLLDGCRKGEPPVSSWSGEPAPTFAAVERELSGADDAFGDELVDAARHSVTGYEHPPAAKSGETDLPVTFPGGDRAGHGGAVFLAAFEGRAGDEEQAPTGVHVAAAADAGTAHGEAEAAEDAAAPADTGFAAAAHGDGGIPDHAEPDREEGSDVGGAVLHGRVAGAPDTDEDESTDATDTVVTGSQLVDEVGDDRADAAVVAPDHAARREDEATPDDAEAPDRPAASGTDVTDEVADPGAGQQPEAGDDETPEGDPDEADPDEAPDEANAADGAATADAAGETEVGTDADDEEA